MRTQTKLALSGLLLVVLVGGWTMWQRRGSDEVIRFKEMMSRDRRQDAVERLCQHTPYVAYFPELDLAFMICRVGDGGTSLYQFRSSGDGSMGTSYQTVWEYVELTEVDQAGLKLKIKAEVQADPGFEPSMASLGYPEGKELEWTLTNVDDFSVENLELPIPSQAFDNYNDVHDAPIF